MDCGQEYPRSFGDDGWMQMRFVVVIVFVFVIEFGQWIHDDNDTEKTLWAHQVEPLQNEGIMANSEGGLIFVTADLSASGGLRRLGILGVLFIHGGWYSMIEALNDDD